MSSLAVNSALGRTTRFYQTTIGKKVVMAGTGVILFGFVVSHLLGNLQFYLGSETMDHYAVALRTMPALLWVARGGLLLAAILHITASVQLTALKNAARPVGYVKKTAVQATWASRTMMWSGPIVLAFLIFHLLHLTWGTVHPNFEELHPYENMVNGFRVIPVAIFYVIAVSFLGLHLYHGVWSMFQSVGVNHPRYTPLLKKFSAYASILLVLGFISIPIAVATGVIS
ncbi:MAG: succinate dehydrogenase cytochrome b subunit [Bryobacteraceae bacterium]